MKAAETEGERARPRPREDAGSSRRITSAIRIVLVRPRAPGNVGAAARAMKNFGFRRLLLVSDRDPRCSPEAFWLAHGAEDVLRNAPLHATLDDALGKVDLVVGTTSRRGNRWRDALDPEALADLLATGWDRKPVAVLFGPEDRGLSVDELARCPWVVRLPTHGRCPSMNLSHAVAVLCYALSRRGLQGAGDRAGGAAAPPAEVRRFLSEFDRFVEAVGFSPQNRVRASRAMGRFRRFLMEARPGTSDLRFLWALLRHTERLVRRCLPEGETPARAVKQGRR